MHFIRLYGYTGPALECAGPMLFSVKAAVYCMNLNSRELIHPARDPLSAGPKLPTVDSIGLISIQVNNEIQTQYLSSSASLRVMMEGYLILTNFRELYYFILMKFTVTLSNI